MELQIILMLISLWCTDLDSPLCVLGESPSSSVSDVDNLNNQALLGKNALAKGVSSQASGNHVLAAHHHHQVMQLLYYVSYPIIIFNFVLWFEYTHDTYQCFWEKKYIT